MESFALATLLFCVYFVAACCFLYKPNQSLCSEQFSLLLREAGEETAPSAPSAPPAPPAPSAPSALFVDQLITMAIALSSDLDPEPEVGIYTPQSRQHHAPTLEELLLGIDLDTMPLRPARKIAGKLGIAQKVNGKDAPLAWLRAQIKNRLSEKPIETAPIILQVMTVA
jgi:hypothetical protein